MPLMSWKGFNNEVALQSTVAGVHCNYLSVQHYVREYTAGEFNALFTTILVLFIWYSSNNLVWQEQDIARFHAQEILGVQSNQATNH